MRDLPFDASAPPDLQYGKNPVTAGQGEVSWNLISRNGQKVVDATQTFSPGKVNSVAGLNYQDGKLFLLIKAD